MYRLDISSLYTNILVAETMGLILDKLYVNSATLYNELRRKKFWIWLQQYLIDTYFIFNGKICPHMEGASQSPIRACYFSKKLKLIIWQDDQSILASIYRRYLDALSTTRTSGNSKRGRCSW